jgi:hypothetical protein
MPYFNYSPPLLLELQHVQVLVQQLQPAATTFRMNFLLTNLCSFILIKFKWLNNIEIKESHVIGYL